MAKGATLPIDPILSDEAKQAIKDALQNAGQEIREKLTEKAIEVIEKLIEKLEAILADLKPHPEPYAKVQSLIDELKKAKAK